MKVVLIEHEPTGSVDYLRDPRVVGTFVRGVHCNEYGVALREGCSEEIELAILLDHVMWAQVVMDEGTDMTQAKPALDVVVYKSVTKVRKREKWGVRIKAGNHLTLFSSEKYVNHEGARNAADIIANGKFTVIDEDV